MEPLVTGAIRKFAVLSNEVDCCLVKCSQLGKIFQSFDVTRAVIMYRMIKFQTVYILPILKSKMHKNITAKCSTAKQAAIQWWVGEREQEQHRPGRREKRSHFRDSSDPVGSL